MKEITSTPIAQGRTAEIYAWDSQHVLKLYQAWCPPDWAEYEVRVAGAVHDAGVPSPAVSELVEVNGRRGLIYERIDGVSMLQDMNTRPWLIWKYARSLAEMQVKIHQQSIPGLPTYKDRLKYDTDKSQFLTENLRDKVLTLLASLPDGEALCHGDYHPGNIIVTRSGPIVIDWMTACSGRSWADVARTSLLLSIGPKGAGNLVSPMIRLAIGLYHRVYLMRYLALIPDSEHEMNRWTPVIAAARLNEGIVPEREALLKIVRPDQPNESFH